MAQAASGVATVVEGLSLLAICVLSFSIRLFSVVKYESVIHEFDPYFNYRVTVFLTDNGFYELWNWFDDRTWYPLGRVVGGTVYPGLIFTAGLMHKVLHFFNLPIHVQEVCVFTAPVFSALCALAAYLFVSEIRSKGAGLLAGAFVGIVPSYISRSVAGSFDNEGVAIFALIFTFYTYLKTLNTGSLAWATASVASYGYMVMSWGGYSFIINLLPIHCLASVVVLMSEHFGAFFAFGVLHMALAIQYVKRMLPPKAFAMAVTLLVTGGTAVLAVAFTAMLGYVMASPTFGWTGRSLSLLDPTYASKYIPIIASVSEHQPPAWTSYFTDIHVMVLFMPAGLIACFRPLTDASLFLLLYGVTAVYFSGVMVRLMLVLAPAACCLAAIAMSELMQTACKSFYLPPVEHEVEEIPVGVKGSASKGKLKAVEKKKDEKKTHASRLPSDLAGILMVALVAILSFYAIHCVWVSAEMYSAPSIVLQSRRPDGSVHVFDDFREAYAWLRHNTDDNAKVASWWDYGYQTTAMANRTVIVDNNTWNNTHIATVGRAMASPEKKAWKIYRYLDVEYVFVVFGALIGYPSDDINKFLWMVRIGGGVFPEIKERDYTGEGQYRIDGAASSIMLNSLMYKLSYYKFADASSVMTGRRGFDRVRNTEIGKMDFGLKYFEEVFTTQHWMVRIYRVRDKPMRDRNLPNSMRMKGKQSKPPAKQRSASGMVV
eukprot:jgi/Tetstr1/462163/TSEL_007228.t1